MRVQAAARLLCEALAASLVLSGASAGQSPASTRQYRYLMGTSVEVEAIGRDEPTRKRAIEAAFAAMGEVDRLMSNYRDDSELTAINHLAALRDVAVTEPMFSVLKAALDVSRRSNGAFDVTVGPLVRLWGFHDKKPHVPDAAELAAVRPLIDYRQVVLDAATRTVRFARHGIELDLGGIAKGFAVELAAGVLRHEALAGFIDAGGNQYLLGTPPGKTRWSIGVKDPDDPRRLLGAIETQETSVSTSADYANFLVENGRRYGHILDPHTLAPSDRALSVTIVGRDATVADALSKAVFILGPKAGLALAAEFPGMAALIAYRGPTAEVAIAMSDCLRPAFHPARN
jgi:thiamine biosynthesis lipoprotein